MSLIEIVGPSRRFFSIDGPRTIAPASNRSILFKRPVAAFWPSHADKPERIERCRDLDPHERRLAPMALGLVQYQMPAGIEQPKIRRVARAMAEREGHRLERPPLPQAREPLELEALRIG